MGKGIIKVTTGPTHKPVKLGTTVSYDSTTLSREETYNGTDPVGGTYTGIIMDSQSGADIDFIQPFGAELGLAVGVKVNFTSVTVNGKPMAVAVRQLEKGIVQTLNQTNDGGTILDKSTGKNIPFIQPYCKELGLVAASGGQKGSVVTYERVVDPNTAEVTAVAVEPK